MTGAQEWEKVKTGNTKLTRERVCVDSQGAKQRRPAKARKREVKRVCLWLSAVTPLSWGYRDSRWGSGEDHLLALTARGPRRQRVMANGEIAYIYSTWIIWWILNSSTESTGCHQLVFWALFGPSYPCVGSCVISSNSSTCEYSNSGFRECS